MSREHVEAEVLVSYLSHRPRYILGGMISIPESPKPSAINRDPASSLGHLNMLPLEVLHMILGVLDFWSLSRCSRVSLRTKVIIESLPEYRDLVEYAPQALAALGCTGAIILHSAATIYSVLRSEKCISCTGYGAFLFLVTCERCCWECLHRNQSLWVIPRAVAGRCFALSQHQLSRLSTIRSIPGAYSVGHDISRQKRLRLVSVRSAKQLAIGFYGSAASLTGVLRARLLVVVCENELYTFKHLQDAPLEPLGQYPSLLPSKANSVDDAYCGMASISFPSLLPGRRVESGLWCRGCELTCERYRFGETGLVSWRRILSRAWRLPPARHLGYSWDSNVMKDPRLVSWNISSIALVCVDWSPAAGEGIYLGQQPESLTPSRRWYNEAQVETIFVASILSSRVRQRRR